MNMSRFRSLVFIVSALVLPLVGCSSSSSSSSSSGDAAIPTTGSSEVTQSSGGDEVEETTTTLAASGEVELPADLPREKVAFPEGFVVVRAPAKKTSSTTTWVIDLEGEGTPEEALAAATAVVGPLGWTSMGEPVTIMAQDPSVELSALSFTSETSDAGVLTVGAGRMADGNVLLRYVLTAPP